MPSDFERARNDLSRLLDGYVKKRLSKREAMQIVDAVLDEVWELGYNECVLNEITYRRNKDYNNG